MSNPIRDEAVQAARSQLLKGVEDGSLDSDSLQGAIAILEKAQIRGDRELLEGEWRLLWTSGTRKAQKLKQGGKGMNRKAIAQVIQRLDCQRLWFENQITLAGSSLIVGGPFEYNQHRIQFQFERLGFQLGPLGLLNLPLGKWASGWLQTTYLDEDLHLERGDRGGISLYQRVGTSTPTLCKDNDRIILSHTPAEE
ncbi:PAP/fibrillin family protein [Laspinema olomoucense]|uniref:PAP/fibrillin family protein n=1 Tax=Laspinema olomoucense TaxID=3231600 RepID=UPI0021BB4BA8|nr:PAP/fibrillin family protein [Laspinema sp. D3d]MCT7972826.1 PAP/fibrillin family protein [Laspinema sp. D3d]